MDKIEVCRRYFGHSGFRAGQELLIDAILAGRDCLGVMPTGGGKSLCYQVPAMLLPGLTLIISPLISLMKDQVAALREAGVPAECWHSGLDEEESRQVWQGVRRDAYKLLYIAPERLDSAGFVELMGRKRVSLVAVDEAHCVSQWGQDFRPSYLKIARFVAGLKRRPVVAAFTAKATGEVRADMEQKLELHAPQVLVTGFDRPNLFFDVREPKSKLAAVEDYVAAHRENSGIIYCATRAKVESVCAALARKGFAATRYHAGLESEERRQNQEDFQFDRKTVMVATNAFGMGIDKSNVSYVLHYNMPKSLEAYYQEAGRAGRDGEPADCILLYSGQDVRTALFLIENGEGKAELSQEERALLQEQEHRRLAVMEGYCKTQGCYRGYILDYFGQAHEGGCGSCGNCTGEFCRRDVTLQAQMLLSCVQRVHTRLGYHVGPALVVRTLRGSRDKRLMELGLDQLSTYGLLRQWSRKQVNDLADHLVREGYAEIETEHHTLRLTPKAGEVLFRGQRVEMLVREEPEQAAPQRAEPQKAQPRAPGPWTDSQELYDRLAALRGEIARSEKVPAYIVFSNATLRDMARRAPTDRFQFQEVNGVGHVKSERYSERFLAVIREYLEENREM